MPSLGVKQERTTTQRTSSHTNVSSPASRSMDITQLNRLEEKESLRHEGTVSGLGQQGSDPDGVDLPSAGDESTHLTFNDVPLSEVLSSKSRYGSSLHAVRDDATIAGAMELIKTYNIGAVLVRSSSTDDIVGIISTRDYIEKVSEGKHPTTSPVTEFMTESPVFAFDDDAAIACLELMVKHNFRHLPVRQRTTGKPVGLVSIGDLVRIMLKQYRESNTFMKVSSSSALHGQQHTPIACTIMPSARPLTRSCACCPSLTRCIRTSSTASIRRLGSGWCHVGQSLAKVAESAGVHRSRGRRLVEYFWLCDAAVSPSTVEVVDYALGCVGGTSTVAM